MSKCKIFIKYSGVWHLSYGEYIDQWAPSSDVGNDAPGSYSVDWLWFSAQRPGLLQATRRQKQVLAVIVLNQLVAQMSQSIPAPFFPEEVRKDQWSSIQRETGHLSHQL